MAKGLKDNHTILGIHFTGNAMNVDALGFLNEEGSTPGQSHIMTRIKESMVTGVVKSRDHIELNANSHCWICEGWTKVRFNFSPKKSYKGHLPIKNVFLHLDFDNYKPHWMDLGGNGDYFIDRMVPPIFIKYHFSINNEDFAYSNEDERRDLNKNIEYKHEIVEKR